MIFICLALCLVNTGVCLYLLKKGEREFTVTAEDEKNEEERKRKEETLNEVFDYDPYQKR